MYVLGEVVCCFCCCFVVVCLLLWITDGDRPPGVHVFSYLYHSNIFKMCCCFYLMWVSIFTVYLLCHFVVYKQEAKI